ATWRQSENTWVTSRNANKNDAKQLFPAAFKDVKGEKAKGKKLVPTGCHEEGGQEGGKSCLRKGPIILALNRASCSCLLCQTAWRHQVAVTKTGPEIQTSKRRSRNYWLQLRRKLLAKVTSPLVDACPLSRVKTVTTLVENKKTQLVVLKHAMGSCQAGGLPACPALEGQAAAIGSQADLYHCHLEEPWLSWWKPSGPFTMTGKMRAILTREATSLVQVLGLLEKGKAEELL
ncbi:hypothetical protein J0S82_016841, partial [Galemys pyrenaicus]